MAYIQCDLCPRRCGLDEGQRGNCRVRTNLNGKMHTLVYGNPCSVHVDPIEKKPLFHFLPTSNALSIATAGCNLHCKYCQNWQISQSRPEDVNNYDLPPEKVVESAIKSHCPSIAYTYSEPIVFYEYMFDTATLAKKKNVRSVMVTAGYINEAPLLNLCPVLDAVKVDLKGITEEFYQNMSFATLAPVLNTLITLKKKGVFVEIVNLIIPTWNDKKEDIQKLCDWVKNNMGPDVPLHFSKFWPMYQLLNLPPTPESTLTMAWEIAKESGINFAYLGNMPEHPGNNTYCPNDKKLLIERNGYTVLQNNIVDGKCKFCNTKIPGIWS